MKNKILLSLFVISSLFCNAQTFYITHNSIVRNYILHLPSGYTSSRSYPLVFNLHGYTSDAIQEQFYTKMDQTSDANGFIVVYPNGISNAWNSGFVGTYGTGVDDVGFISLLIDTLSANYNINQDRIYSCGMSNGGYQSYRMACELSHRIAAIASVTGSMTDSAYFYCNPSRPVPIMQIHGTSDPTVNYNGSFNSKSIESVLQYWKSFNHCIGSIDTFDVPNTNTTDLSTAQFIRFNSCDSGYNNWFYKINNGGHTWPSAILDIPGAGSTNRDFDASQRIWDFFSQFTLKGTTTGITPQYTNSIRVYPNPVSDVLIVELVDNVVLDKLELADITGKTVLQSSDFTTHSNTYSLDISKLHSGIYFIKGIDMKGYVLNKKVIISH